MSKELLFLFIAVIDIFAVFAASRLGREWLLGTVAVNLILVGVFGAKLITIFGFVTNAGNAFYACVFLATHFLLEKHGRREGTRAFWFGTGAVLLFVAMSQSAILLTGLAESIMVNEATRTLFSFTPRIFFASIVAYLFAQSVNVSVYERLRTATHGRLLWLRSNAANMAGQLVDSSIFFTIAFIDMPGPALIQAILTGWVVKMAVVALGTPLLYLDTRYSKG